MEVKTRVYRGWNVTEGRWMYAVVFGQMVDGTFCYAESDKDGNELPNPEGRWYSRHVRAGYYQYFIAE